MKLGIPAVLRSFRVRIALLAALTSGAVLLAFSLWTYGVVERLSLRRIDETLFDIAQRHLSHPQDPRHWDHVAASLQAALGNLKDNPFILLVKGPGGEVLYATPNWPGEISPRAFPIPEHIDWGAFPGFNGRPAPPPRGGRMPDPSMGPFRGGGPPPPPLPVLVDGYMTRPAARVDWRIGVFSSPEATFVLGLNLDRYHGELDQLRRAFLVVLPVALLFIALSGWWLSQRALRPVRALTRAAEGITAKGLDRRIPLTDEDAEFDRLIRVFNHMLDRLETSFKQAVRFSADAAHELKTPLTILQGELEQALQDRAPGSPEQQLLNRLLEEVQRLKAITRKLLLLSLADSGQLKVHLEPVNLSDATEAVGDDLEILAPNLRIEKQVEPGLWTAADPDLLRQVVQNLTSNAIKYNEPGGTIRLELRGASGRLRLTIGNTGRGIPPADRDRIFERFFRADKARNRRVDGAGLGLSLAREIARAHHGDLVLDEAGDGWTAFALTLPQAPRPLAPALTAPDLHDKSD